MVGRNGNSFSATAQGSSIWISLAGAVVAAVGYGWYLAAAQGTMQAGLVETERRISSIEQYGSPVIGAVRTAIDVNTHRLTVLEDRVPVLFSADSTQRQEAAKEAVMLTDVARRVSVLEAGSIPPVSDRLSDLKAASSAQEHQIKIIIEEQARLRDGSDRHRERDAENQVSLAARLATLEAEIHDLNNTKALRQ